MQTLSRGATSGAERRGIEPPRAFELFHVGRDDCGGILALSQPLDEYPDRLIGACEDCGEVYAVRMVGLVPTARLIAFPRRRLNVIPPAAAG